MSDDIPIARPLLDEEEVAAARRAILSGWIMQGPEVAAFEREFAAAVGAPHAAALSSGTAALHLALLAVGVGPGDEVVTVSYSFIATANSVRFCGATPVFVDIEPATFNIDPAHVEAALTPRTRAILCVHQLGMPCDLVGLAAIARRHGLPLVEDAACAAGSQVEREGAWQPIGRPHGEVACFSFHPRKVITTGDGGMITTARPEIDEKVRLLRAHGMTAGGHAMVAFNYRLTDLQAAVGRVQLGRLPALVAERRALAARYGRLLAGRGLGLPVEPPAARSNWQSYCVRLPDGADPARVVGRLAERGVMARRGVSCAHREPAYAREPWRAAPGGLVESERAQDTTICLPIYAGLGEAAQDRVVAALDEALA